MNRSDLINTIEALKESDSIEHDIDLLIGTAEDFCNSYECDFNNIRDALEPLAEHIPLVEDAYDAAKRCSDELY